MTMLLRTLMRTMITRMFKGKLIRMMMMVVTDDEDEEDDVEEDDDAFD